jgi:PDDEXK-like uncharacterized protein DUF3799
VYHSIVAGSASGLKNLSASAMDYWANSRMNPNWEEDEKETIFKAMGRAFHCRICEGEKVFGERYYVELDQGDYDCDWSDAYVERRPLCITVRHLRLAIDGLGGKPKGTEKAGLIGQLVDLDPRWPIWDLLTHDHAEANDGKTPISAKTHRRIEIANRMITAHPDLKEAFSDGYAEVSLFWFCPRTGVPMKCRIDYLKLNAFIDLKTFSNPMGKPVQRAVDSAISNGKHFIPVVVYQEGIAAVKKLVREAMTVFMWNQQCSAEGGGGAAIGACGELRDWVWQWAHQPEPVALYVYQKTGNAPVTIGRTMEKGTTYTVNEFAVQWLKRKWRENYLAYGVDPWIDIEPITRTTDESLTWAATDFGETE